jgi:hypothetical protein
MKKIFAKIAAISVAAIFVLGSCCNQSDKNANKPHNFPKTQPPAMLGQGTPALVYVARNYWNPFIDSSEVFSQDTSLIGGVPIDQFINAGREYAHIVNSIPLQEGIKAQTNFISRLIALERSNPENTVFHIAVEYAEEVFYGVNSDYRNEELYLPIASALADFELIDSITRAGYAQEVINCSKNRVGTPAADFCYTTKNGMRSTLYKTRANATLIFFSNPGCTACKEIIETLDRSLLVQKLLSEEALTIINIYIDEDLSEWYKYMPIYPQEWINCYNEDLSIKGESLYDIRAIPSLYLLDKDKRVILKDATLHTLMDRLHYI